MFFKTGGNNDKPKVFGSSANVIDTPKHKNRKKQTLDNRDNSQLSVDVSRYYSIQSQSTDLTRYIHNSSYNLVHSVFEAQKQQSLSNAANASLRRWMIIQNSTNQNFKNLHGENTNLSSSKREPLKSISTSPILTGMCVNSFK